VTKADRYERLRAIGCLCCIQNAAGEQYLAPLFPVEIHHLNGGGHHGQKRRGDLFTIPLCSWHHRGEGPAKEYTEHFGPSWAKGSKPFRAEYGTDDELLAAANLMIGVKA
jgi:hypothetical protein